MPQSRYQCITVLPFRMDSKRPTALLIWHMSPLCMKPVLAPVDEPKWNWQLSVMARLTSNSRPRFISYLARLSTWKYNYDRVG